MVKYLVENDTSVNPKNSSFSPLVRALKKKRFDIAEYLLEKGAHSNVRDKDGDTPLHVAPPFYVKPKFIQELIDRGANINAKNQSGRTPLRNANGYYGLFLLDGKHYLPSTKKLIEILIKNGADLDNTDTIGGAPPSPKQFLGKDVLQKRKEIIRLLNLVKQKNTKNVNDNVKKIISLVEDEDSPIYDKQTAIADLFKLRKNSGKIIFRKKDIEKFLKYIPFNYRFFNTNDFKEILKYSLRNNLKDTFGRSILHSSAIYAKNKNFVLRAFLKSYNFLSYGSNIQKKQNLINDVKKTLSKVKELNKKLYISLRNVDITWNDLSNKELVFKNKTFRAKRRERLEPAIVSKIMNFMGIHSIKNEKIYYR
ncbi:ankyrin repeat domain-containing protein [Candidatus Dependentiae bacterium]